MQPAASSPRLRIAIDGPAGAGKSTVAQRVAQALDYLYIDTGAMYRAVAWAVLERNLAPDDAEAITALVERLDIELRPGPTSRVFVDSQEISDVIRTPAISNLTSPLSSLPGVRRRLAALQQALAAGGGVVMEGRDIGTVVLPDAEVKVFLTASLAQRVRRRRAELAARGIMMDAEALQADIAARDARDSARALAPLIPAPDAVVLDSDQMTADEVAARILALHREAQEHHGR